MFCCRSRISRFQNLRNPCNDLTCLSFRVIVLFIRVLLCFILSSSTFWPTIRTWRWLFLGVAVSPFSVRFIEYQLKSPNYLMAIESSMWIFTMFGFAFKYHNQPSRILSYLSQGAYPIYIIHMIFLYLGSFLIIPLDIPVLLKFFLLVAFTTIGCLTLYDLLIKRVRFLRPLFGLKKEISKKEN